jgi:hypothetical protein
MLASQSYFDVYASTTASILSPSPCVMNSTTCKVSKMERGWGEAKSERFTTLFPFHKIPTLVRG